MCLFHPNLCSCRALAPAPASLSSGGRILLIPTRCWRAIAAFHSFPSDFTEVFALEVGQELVSESLIEVPGFAAVFAPPQRPAVLSSSHRGRFPFPGRCGWSRSPRLLRLLLGKGGRCQSPKALNCLKKRGWGRAEAARGSGWDVGSCSTFGVGAVAAGAGPELRGCSGAVGNVPAGSGILCPCERCPGGSLQSPMAVGAKTRRGGGSGTGRARLSQRLRPRNTRNQNGQIPPKRGEMKS